jgi:hypothetical protein
MTQPEIVWHTKNSSNSSAKKLQIFNFYFDSGKSLANRKTLRRWYTLKPVKFPVMIADFRIEKFGCELPCLDLKPKTVGFS